MRVRSLAAVIACVTTGLLGIHQLSAQAPAAGQATGRGRAPYVADLLYVGSPGSHESINDMGVLVFDVKNNFQLVKRMTTWDFPASHEPVGVWAGEETRGIAASPATGLLYIATAKRIAAFDIMTEKKVWEVAPGGTCCDRQAISPDGKFLYVPSAGGTRREWYVLDGKTGATIKTLDLGGPVGPHNTVYAPDGTRVYMEGTGSKIIYAADPRTHTVVQQIGPFTQNARPFTVNGSNTLLFSCVNDLLGFEIADLKTGKMIHRVEVAGFTWGPNREIPHGVPSHGIAMSPDEKEIWVTDGVNDHLHVFDATVMPPKQKADVPTTHGVVGIGWVNFSHDGKYVFAASGDVFDAATKKRITTLTDEKGRVVNSEKIVEVLISEGKVTKVADQFGIGQVRRPATD
jgi:DNA-binding beta-propeller fold protein YncE